MSDHQQDPGDGDEDGQGSSLTIGLSVGSNLSQAVSKSDRYPTMNGQSMRAALNHHWPEYLMEAAELGIFMIAAAIFTAILEHPASTVHLMLPDPFTRRVLMGITMGLTATIIIYSPWGKQSGAHFNPAVTMTFLRLGRMTGWDAMFYCVAQFSGGLAGILLSGVFLNNVLSHPSVRYAATVPGQEGVLVAFAAEFAISFILMSVVLRVSGNHHIASYTGLSAGALVAVYIILESPLSGMSMNPARTLASAFPANIWTGLWIYFIAPISGMLLAGEVYRSRAAAACAKLHHANTRRCIFCNKPAEPTH